jgi:hypothetical protein
MMAIHGLMGDSNAAAVEEAIPDAIKDGIIVRQVRFDNAKGRESSWLELPGAAGE